MNGDFPKQTISFKFHFCYHYAIIPLGIFYMALFLLAAFSELFYFLYWINWAYFLFFIVEAGLLIAQFVGLFHWEGYAWQCIQAQFLAAGYLFAVDVLNFCFYGRGGVCTVPVVVAGIAYVYYSARRRLFRSQSKRSDPENQFEEKAP